MTFYDLFKDMNHLGTDAAQIPRDKKGKLCIDFASQYLCKRDFRWISKDGTRSLLAQAVEDLTGPI